MAQSEVSICNGALSLLGADRIMALTEDSEEARACNERYEPVRDAVLQLHPWNFCTFRTQLTASDVKPEYYYQYQYPLPTSPLTLLVLEVYEDDDWVLEHGNLLSNSSVIQIKYIGKVTDPLLYPPLVADLISARLAVEIGYKLTGSTSIVTQVTSLYAYKLKEAVEIESKQGRMPQLVDDLFIDTWLDRFGS